MIKNVIKSLILAIIVGFIYFYIVLPPINLHSMQFYVFAFVIYAVFIGALSCFEYGKFFDGKTISSKIISN